MSSASRKHPNRCFKYITDLNNLLHWCLSRNPLQLFGRKTGIYIKRAAYNHRNSYNKKSNHLIWVRLLAFHSTWHKAICVFTQCSCATACCSITPATIQARGVLWSLKITCPAPPKLCAWLYCSRGLLSSALPGCQGYSSVVLTMNPWATTSTAIF